MIIKIKNPKTCIITWILYGKQNSCVQLQRLIAQYIVIHLRADLSHQPTKVLTFKHIIKKLKYLLVVLYHTTISHQMEFINK